MKNSDLQGQCFSAFMKALPKTTAVKPTFKQNTNGILVLTSILVGSKRCFISDNDYSITKEQYMSKKFRTALGARTISVGRVNANQLWLNEPQVTETTADW